jgi:hypothetical protein
MILFMTGGNEFNGDFFCLKHEINYKKAKYIILESQQDMMAT